MSKELTLIRSTKLLSRNHPTLCFCLGRVGRQMPNVTRFMIRSKLDSYVLFSIYRTVCLEFFQTVTSKTKLKLT